MNPTQRNQAIAVGALALVLIVIVWYQFFRGPSLPAPPVPDPAAVGAATGEEPATSVFETVDIDIAALTSNIKEVDFRYGEQRESRDPMSALLGSNAQLAFGAGVGPDGQVRMVPEQELLFAASRKTLSGILWDQTEPLAIIDDFVVGVGYTFEPEKQITVKEITPTSVILSVNLGDRSQDITKELKKPETL